jgi:integrase
LRHFHNSLEKAGVPRVKIHSLRHTFVSYLIAKNVPSKGLQVIAAHSSFAVTMYTYGNIIKGGQKEAARKLEGVFKV